MRVSAGFKPARAALWAATWAFGVALGVALGGWLTVVGGAGTPGVAALDITEDMVALPLAAGGIMFVVHFLGQFVVSVINRHRAPHTEHGDYENGEPSVHEDVDW